MSHLLHVHVQLLHALLGGPQVNGQLLHALVQLVHALHHLLDVLFGCEAVHPP